MTAHTPKAAKQPTRSSAAARSQPGMPRLDNLLPSWSSLLQRDPARRPALQPRDLPHVQRTLGNQAAIQLLRSQPGAARGLALDRGPADPAEREADAVAARVTAPPFTAIGLAGGGAAPPFSAISLAGGVRIRTQPVPSGATGVVQRKGGKGNRWIDAEIEEGMDEVYGGWDDDYDDYGAEDEEEPTLSFSEQIASAAAARNPERTASAIKGLEDNRAGPEAAARAEARRFGNEFRRLIDEATRAANDAVNLSVRAGIVAGRLGGQGQESQAMAREAEKSGALASIRAQDAGEGESMERASVARRLALEAKQRATWALARADSNVQKMEVQRQTVVADTAVAVAETIQAAGLVRRMMEKAKPKDQSILNRVDGATQKANIALSKSRGAHRLDAAESAFAEAQDAEQWMARAKSDTVALLKNQAKARKAPPPSDDDILSGPQTLRDLEAMERAAFLQKQRIASRNVTSPGLMVNESLTIPGYKVMQWYQEVTKQSLPDFYSNKTSDLTRGGVENLAVGPGNWLDVWGKLRRREQQRESRTHGFGAVRTPGSSFPLIGQVGVGGRSFSVEEKQWVKPQGTGTASRYYQMGDALATGKAAHTRAANIRKVLSGDTTGVDPHETEAALAMFGSEVARNPRSYGVGLMLLDLVENQAKYGKGGGKAYTWDKILASNFHGGENETAYNRRKTSATTDKTNRWANFTRTLQAQSPAKFHRNPTKTLWAGKWSVSPAASMSLGSSQAIPGSTTDLNVVQYKELKTILNWYIHMMKGDPMVAKSETDAETQLKAIFKRRLGSTAKTSTLTTDW